MDEKRAGVEAGIEVGIDIIEIGRIGRVLNAKHAPRFLARVYTPGELAYCKGKKALERLAGRWAAKEAGLKAIGVGIGPASLRDVEVVKDGRGKPSIRLHGRAAKIAEKKGLTRFSLSISHSRDYAVAFVVATGD